MNAYNPGAVGMQQLASGVVNYGIADNAQNTGTVDVATIPAGCVILDTIVNVTTAFNGTPVLSVGTNESVDNLVNSTTTAAGTVGIKTTDPAVILKTTTVTTVKAKLSVTTAPTAGRAEVYVIFARVE